VTVRVLLVDDQPDVRAALRSLLELDPAIAVVGEAGDGEHAAFLAAELAPDVVLMDIRMPGVDGLTATARLAGTGTRVVVLTSFDLDEYVFAALRAGASGFLVKNAPPDDLHRAVHVVAAGQALLDPAVTGRVIERFARRGPGPGRLRVLTAREREIVRHIAEGLSNDEIAAALQLSVWTVKTHVGAILRKLGARDRTHIVIAAYEDRPPDPR
jgi:DNA-binding NarL/FixJ family response regulator